MKIFLNSLRGSSLLLLIFLLCNCSSLRPTSNVNYAEAWQKVLNSKAWQDALIVEESPAPVVPEEDFYVSNEAIVLADDFGITKGRTLKEPSFEAKYDLLVKRAYVKIIAQATKANDRLEREYILRNASALKKGENRSEEFNRKLELINTRYYAHREMLEGLKSWNIFSEYGTDDLAFFKTEQKEVVKDMILNGKGEAYIINYLIYKLADLYHFEG